MCRSKGGLHEHAYLRAFNARIAMQHHEATPSMLKCKSMISANVIKGVHELLDERGIRPKPGEAFGDTVARALDISARQSEILLERLHDGASVDEAVAAAEIEIAQVPADLLVRIATAIGTALGRVNRS